MELGTIKLSGKTRRANMSLTRMLNFGAPGSLPDMRAFLLVTAIWLLGTAQALNAAPRSLVPEGWREVTPSGSAGGERVFESPDGEARLRLGYVMARSGIRDRLAYRDGETITYQRQGRSWLVVSGYRDGEIFYRKSSLACHGTRWHTIELQYPREAKQSLDRVVASIARNMGDYSSECG